MIREEDIRLARFLVSKGYIDKVRMDKFQRAMNESASKRCTDVLIDTIGVREEIVAQAISEEFKIPFINLTPAIISVSDTVQKEAYVRKYNALPIIRSGVELTVAIVNPPYKNLFDAMKRDEKTFVVPVVAKRSAFDALVLKQPVEEADEFKKLQSKFQVETLDLRSKGKEKVYEVFRSGKVPNADMIVDEILIRAVKHGATDVYFEPMEGEFRVRYNVDGMIEHAVSLPKELTEPMSNVMRARGSLNVFDKRKAQDGVYTAQYGTMAFDLRVSTLPTIEGERFSIRILKKVKRSVDIDELGFTAENLLLVRHLFNRPRGLLVICGPSAGGKTTTMYGLLNELRNSQKNIMTVEDPVEYRFEFASQVHVDVEQNLDYAATIRAVMRHRPDIIVLGEIRDAEAGAAAAEAALTGAMVVTTVLSSDALSAIPRLANLGIPHAWLATTVNGIIFQQLVRRICKFCRESYTPTKHMLQSAGLGQLEGSIMLYRGKGCDVCGGDGYLGRTAIHEVLVVDESIQDLIFEQASPITIKAAAAKKGFETLRFDAAKKLVAGTISLEEYLRVMG
ncbi:MAG: type II/IV secretion system protein [Ignavibacteriales bacterium]|nr:type II/IV secretion system protein [Ignavibacteriales bacterium]